MGAVSQFLTMQQELIHETLNFLNYLYHSKCTKIDTEDVSQVPKMIDGF